MTDKPKHFGTIEGEVFATIAFMNHLSFRELARELGLPNDKLYDIIGHLLDDKAISVCYNNAEFRPDSELVVEWENFFDSLTEEEIDDLFWEGYSTENYIDLDWDQIFDNFCREWDITYSKGQGFFYLPDEALGQFHDIVLTRGSKRMYIINPFFDYYRLKNKLIRLSRKDTLVIIITRPPYEKSNNYEKVKAFHDELVTNGVIICYNDNIHAKIILADNVFSVISSMNFMKRSISPYIYDRKSSSWEAGVVITSDKIIDEIKISINEIDCIQYHEYWNPRRK